MFSAIRAAAVAVFAIGSLAPCVAHATCCPAINESLTAQQVFNARNAALAQGDLNTAFCYYDEDATVILPGTLVTGREAIKAAFLNFGTLFGGAQPVVTTQTSTSKVLLITYSLTGPIFSILDGADTFVVKHGRITTQTVHATLQPSP